MTNTMAHQDLNLASLLDLSCSHGARLRDKFRSDLWSMIYSVSVPSTTMQALQSDCFMRMTSCTATKATKEGKVVEVLCRRVKVPRSIEGFKFCESLIVSCHLEAPRQMIPATSCVMSLNTF